MIDADAKNQADADRLYDEFREQGFVSEFHRRLTEEAERLERERHGQRDNS